MFFESVCIFIGIALLYTFMKKYKPMGKIIGGPKGLPILGNFLELNSETIHFTFTDYAKKFGEICRLKILFDNVIVMNSEKFIREAFGGERYKRYFGDRRAMFYGEHFRCHDQSLAFITCGSDLLYRKMRKIYVRALHTSGAQESEYNVMVGMADLIERIQDKSGTEFECVSMLQRSLSNLMSLDLCGEIIADNDPDKNLFWDHVQGNDFFLNAYVNLVMATFPFLRYLPGKYGDMFRKGKKANGKIVQRYFFHMKKTYASGQKRGLVDHFLEEQEKQMHSDTGLFLTDERIIAQLVETIDAGIATTWAALVNTMLILLNYPQYQTKIQAELDTVVGCDRMPTFADRDKCKYFLVFEMEVHRYLTVSPFALPRLCREHIEFEGYDIPANSTIFTNIWHVHHNEEIWGDPWNFRPERFLDERGDVLPTEHILRRNWIPFGYGLRQCPGEMFAKSRYFLYIASLLQRWSFEFPTGKERPCDPRLTENFDIELNIRARPFFCCAKERQ